MIDMLDRVLDKGIVTDSWVRISLGALDFNAVDARMVVDSIETYQKHTEHRRRRAGGTAPADGARRDLD